MAEAREAEQPQEPANFDWKGLVYQLVTVYFVTNLIGGLVNKGRQTGQVVSPNTGTAIQLRNLWESGTEFDMRVFITEHRDFVYQRDRGEEIYLTERLRYDWSPANERGQNVTLAPTFEMLHNGTVYAHSFVYKSGYSFHPEATSPSGFVAENSLYVPQQMNVYAPAPRNKGLKNLLSDNSEKAPVPEAVETPTEWVSYFRPVLSMRIVVDFTKYSAIPPQFGNSLRVDVSRGGYFPHVYADYFWMLNERMVLLNDTVDTLDVEVSFSPISVMKWQLQKQMEQSWEEQKKWGSTEEESNEVRRILLESNPYLLAITGVVSIFHMLFDFLAFKNDIKFWKEQKSMEGLSVRSVFLNAFMQLVIFLYLMDNETSWMILLSSGVGVLIELWKIRRAANVRMDGEFPYVHIEDKIEYSESRTAEYDRDAMRYLSYALFPILIGYAVYALIYNEHKSWYSWVLGSLTGCVYTFGFITMCPQLYLNYKLKSVAHLPWRMLTYKALNTFIDDLFAFVIKMPMLHRLACFRDDIVFFIYLYQRYIYRVDYSRVNEFGLVPGVEGAEEAAAEEVVEGASARGSNAGVAEESGSESVPEEESTNIHQNEDCEKEAETTLRRRAVPRET